MLYIGMARDVAASPVSTGPTPVQQLQRQVAPASKSPASTPARVKNPGFISQASFGHHFSPIVPRLAARGLPPVWTRETPGGQSRNV